MTRQPQTPVVLRARVAMLLLAAMTTLAAAGNHANADGGRLLRTVKSGDWRVSIFAAPDPPRVGLVDVGVLLQNDSTGAVVSNAEIIVTLRTIEPLDGTPVAESAAATPDQSTNKLLQSALLELPRAGDWQGAIDVAADGRTASIPFELTVASGPPPWRSLAPWVLWPGVAIALFAVHRRLAARHGSRRLRRGVASQLKSASSRVALPPGRARG